jgi:hypothetical protein
MVSLGCLYYIKTNKKLINAIDVDDVNDADAVVVVALLNRFILR